MEHNKFKNTKLNKVTWKNIDSLTEETIAKISKIDNLYRNNARDIISNINNCLKNKENIIIYYLTSGTNVLGAAFGHLKSMDKTYLKGNPNHSVFNLDQMFIAKKHQKEGFGTFMMSHIVNDQILNYNTKLIHMRAFPNMQKINEKLTGKRAILVSIGKKEPQKIYRKFKHSRYRFDLVTIPDAKNPSPISITQRIQISDNPEYKKPRSTEKKTVRKKIKIRRR